MDLLFTVCLTTDYYSAMYISIGRTTESCRGQVERAEYENDNFISGLSDFCSHTDIFVHTVDYLQQVLSSLSSNWKRQKINERENIKTLPQPIAHAARTYRHKKAFVFSFLKRDWSHNPAKSHWSNFKRKSDFLAFFSVQGKLFSAVAYYCRSLFCFFTTNFYDPCACVKRY